MKTAFCFAARIPLLILGAVFTVNAILYAFLADINIGFIGALSLGLISLAWGIFFDRFIKKLPVWIKATCFSCLCALLIFLCFLLVFGSVDTVTYDEDAVIVLGSGLKGDKIPAGLEARLEAALEYHKKNPEAVIVLSGGQGSNEALPESIAMKNYLLARGVPQEKIITEELSANTFENFKFSKQILSQAFEREYRVAFITSDYHVFRSQLFAEGAGFTATHAGARAPLITVLPDLIRECAGLARLLLSGY